MARREQSGSGIPEWWPVVISSVGLGWGTMVLVFRIDLPAFYPVIGVTIAGGLAAYGDRILRRRSEDDDA